MKESLNIKKIEFKNQNSINYLFNFKKKLIRNFLYFFYIIYFYNPYSSFNFYSTPTNELRLETSILLIVDNTCVDNFYNFSI